MIGGLSPVFPASSDMLETIRRAVLSHPTIDDCVVVPRRTVEGETVIVAYALFAAGQEMDQPELLRFTAELHAHLPASSVPGLVVPISTIPLSRDGAVDTDRLSRMEVLDESVLQGWREAFPAGIEATLAINRVLPSSRSSSSKASFRVVWRTAAARPEPPRRGSVLIFADSSGIGETIAARLRHSGSNACALASPGVGFQRFDPGRFNINPASPDDYRRLIELVTRDSGTVSHIVHLWSAEPYAGAETWRASQERGIYSLLSAVQAVTVLRRQLNDLSPIRVQVVSRNTQLAERDDRIAWERTPILGLIRSMSIEMPMIDCRHVDLDGRPSEDDAATILREMGIVGMDREIAWRGGRRVVPRLGKIDFDANPTLPDSFRPQGSYLISGGAGRVGRDIAKYLLTTYDANVMLIGRSPVEQVEGVLNELASCGGRLHYESADVCESASLNRAVNRIKSLWGWEFDGVFHLAGVSGRQPIMDESAAAMATAMEARVRGAENLARHVVYRPADTRSGLKSGPGPAIFVVVSSTVGFFGAEGQAAYAASNRALESFCASLRIRGFKAHNIAIPKWDSSGGDGVGIDNLMAALSSGHSEVLVGLDSLDPEIKRWVDGASPRVRNVYAYTAEPQPNLHDELDAKIVLDRFGTRTGCHLRVRRNAGADPIVGQPVASDIEATPPTEPIIGQSSEPVASDVEATLPTDPTVEQADAESDLLPTAAAGLPTDYWVDLLSGLPTTIEIPPDFQRATITSAVPTPMVRQDVWLAKKLTDAVGDVAESAGTTLLTAMQCAFQILIMRHTSARRFILGVQAGDEVLPIPVNLSGDPSFRDILQRTQETLLAIESAELVTASEIASVMGMEPDHGVNPLVQLVFCADGPDEETRSSRGRAPYDLALHVRELPDGVEAWIDYAPDLYKAETASALANHIRTLLEAVVDEPYRRLSIMAPDIRGSRYQEATIEMMLERSAPVEARSPVAIPSYDPAVESPSDSQAESGGAVSVSSFEGEGQGVSFADSGIDRSLHQLFQEIAEATPDAVAIVEGDDSITYKTLDRRANQLAHYLLKHGGGFDVPIGLLLPPSIDAIVAMLAIHKAEGAYAPLDGPGAENTRLAGILADLNLPIVVTRAAYLAGLPRFSGEIVCVDRDAPALNEEPTYPCRFESDPETLALVSFVDRIGLDGDMLNLGVAIPHAGLASSIQEVNRRYGIGASDSVWTHSPVASLSFALEVFGILAAGGKLTISPYADSMPKAECLGDATIWHATPADVAALGSAADLGQVRLVLLDHNTAPLPGGQGREGFDPAEAVKTLRTLKPELTISVLTGTAETSGCWAIYDVPQDPRDIPFGHPLPGRIAFVLDGSQQVAEDGISGDLYIGGGLARGYYRKPDITSTRFSRIAISGAERRLLKSGIRATLQSDGSFAPAE